MISKLKNMKKVELHLHLDGSVSLEMASKLTNLSSLELREKMIARDRCLNLTEYLTKFDLPISIMQSYDNLVLIARDLVNYLERENVIYAEVRFAPVFHTKDGLSMERVVEAVLEGLNSNNRVKTNLILCMMRGMDYDTNLSVIELACKYLKKGVVAIDLAGDECKYPLDEYSELFKIAKIKEIPFTIHAGEAGGAEEVKKAILLGASRIGHGVHCVDDIEVLRLVCDSKVLLEVCPTSNIQTGVKDEYSKHPIYDLYKGGIRVNINTDNKTVSNVSLSHEYVKLYENFDFSMEDFIKMNEYAIESSFLTLEERQELLKKLK